MVEAKSTSERASADLPLGSAVIKEAELWMGAQGDLLSGIETMMTGWMRRQRQAFEASSRSVQKICDARNIFDLLKAQQDWLSDCLDWTASEIRAVGGAATMMTRKATERLGEPSSWLDAERPKAGAPLERAAAE
jgi:hypothetical protein